VKTGETGEIFFWVTNRRKNAKKKEGKSKAT
jgi:hypothetical protein